MSQVTKKEKKRILVRLVEFFIIGIVMGVAEDLIAIYFATDAQINLKVIKVAIIVAIPFAIISELVSDSKIIGKFFKHSE